MKPDKLSGFFETLGTVSVWGGFFLEFTLKKRTNVSFLFFFVDFGFLDSLEHWVSIWGGFF